MTFQPQNFQVFNHPMVQNVLKNHGWKVHGWKVWGLKVRGWDVLQPCRHIHGFQLEGFLQIFGFLLTLWCTVFEIHRFFSGTKFVIYFECGKSRKYLEKLHTQTIANAPSKQFLRFCPHCAPSFLLKWNRCTWIIDRFAETLGGSIIYGSEFDRFESPTLVQW